MEELLALIGDIYDASLDPRIWPLVLERAAHYINGCSAMLLAQDVVSLRGRFFFSWNDNPEFTKSFFDSYMKINPLTPHAMMTKVGEVFAASSLVPYAELRASKFFQEWCVPQGYTDLVAVTLEKSATSVANFSVSRDVNQGLMDEEAVARMRLLAPHLRRAVMIGKAVELHKLETARLADTLDGLASGIFLVDGGGAVVYANASGEAMLSKADVLSTGPGGLAATGVEADRALRAALAAAREGDAALATKGVAVPIASREGELHLAHVLPLTSGSRRAAGLTYDAVAAVFVRRTTLELPSPIETAAEIYKLSRAEIRVLYAVIEVGGVAAVADMLGISEATVKTHLQHLFEKTGTSRQIDLVKLVAGFADPLA